jgi:hypothetical protein
LIRFKVQSRFSDSQRFAVGCNIVCRALLAAPIDTSMHINMAPASLTRTIAKGHFMAYMLLMLEPNGQRATRTEAEGRAVYDRMLHFADDLKAKGLLLGVESLSSHANASRVRVEQGQARVLDGPFAEAKEMIGGFFLVDCQTREEAIALALQCPAAEWCTVEVRGLAPCYES